MAKLRWIEVEGMKYVADYEDDHNHCVRCAFFEASVVLCRQVKCDSNVFIPLEPQHIPNLRKIGKTKWLS